MSASTAEYDFWSPMIVSYSTTTQTITVAWCHLCGGLLSGWARVGDGYHYSDFCPSCETAVNNHLHLLALADEPVNLHKAIELARRDLGYTT